jgi:hypothetical protein
MADRASLSQISIKSTVTSQSSGPPAPLKGALKNKFALLFFIFFLTCILLPDLIANSFYDRKKNNNLVFNQGYMRITLLFLCFTTVISAWAIFFLALCFKRHAPIGTSGSSGTNNDESYKKTITYRILQVLQTIMIITMSLYFGFLLIFRSAAQTRRCYTPFGTGDWNCNPYQSVPIFPMDTAFILILIPSCFAVVMKEKRTHLTMISWSISVLSMVTSAVAIKSTDSIAIVVIYFLLSGVVLTDSFRMHLKIAKLYESLRLSMEETQALLDQQKLNQMKDVIGNVSHDLKTVSFLILCLRLFFLLFLFSSFSATFFVHARNRFNDGYHVGF